MVRGDWPQRQDRPAHDRPNQGRDQRNDRTMSPAAMVRELEAREGQPRRERSEHRQGDGRGRDERNHHSAAKGKGGNRNHQAARPHGNKEGARSSGPRNAGGQQKLKRGAPVRG